jgi:beta-xylosidase
MTKMQIKILIVFSLFLLTGSCTQNSNTQIANSQFSVQTYHNPIIHADYSDPDVIKVGSKFYMTASSFNCIPGLPLLESDDLVHWNLIGYAIKSLEPDSVFSKPQHGNGIWAPSLRYHNNRFYIYYGDPDYGIYMLSTDNIYGAWSKPILVKRGKGWIDPCPFWDTNGKAWLVHAWAGSRAGIKSILTLHQMSPDGTQLLDDGIMVFDGHDGNNTVEGPKLYKFNGYYYIFAPAGGVTLGWQLAMRSKNIQGPYEYRKVMEQGKSPVNGPHQGGWVQTDDGSSWFIHFQDKGAFGRIIHLQPMKWMNDWPVIGNDPDGDGIGEPVMAAQINMHQQNTNFSADSVSDEFNTASFNKHWQWHANPDPRWGGATGYLGFLRLNAVVTAATNNLWDAPNLLLQKFPSKSFTVTTKLETHFIQPGEKAGLVIMGEDYAYIALDFQNNKTQLVMRSMTEAYENQNEQTLFSCDWNNTLVYFRVQVNPDADCHFSYCSDGENFTELPSVFKAVPGRWIGAKTGLFCSGSKVSNNAGNVNVDWFRFRFELTN